MSIEVSDAGRVSKDVGEPAGLTTNGSEQAFFEITISNIAVVTTAPAGASPWRRRTATSS